MQQHRLEADWLEGTFSKNVLEIQADHEPAKCPVVGLAETANFHRKLEEDTATTTDPNGYLTPFDIMLSI